MGFSLASGEARALRDERVAEVSAQPFQDLVKRMDGHETQRQVKAPSGRQYEVVTEGSFDHPEDPTSDFYVWIYVRPTWVAGIPFVRWLFSARATLIPNL